MNTERPSLCFSLITFWDWFDYVLARCKRHHIETLAARLGGEGFSINNEILLNWTIKIIADVLINRLALCVLYDGDWRQSWSDSETQIQISIHSIIPLWELSSTLWSVTAVRSVSLRGRSIKEGEVLRVVFSPNLPIMKRSLLASLLLSSLSFLSPALAQGKNVTWTGKILKRTF